MKKMLFLILISGFSLSCQDFGKLKILASLPNSMKEASGIEAFSGSELVWIIGDAGNPSTVFGLDIGSESFKRVIDVENVTNRDWEDLASDNSGNLYIGDFGNNGNKRKDLVIYTIENFSEITSKSTTAKATYFYYEDQDKFPPKKKNRNYDVEGFFYLDNHFYLFTRNRSSDFDGTTKLYKVPAKEGNFEAKLIDEFKTCKDKRDCDITAAAIDQKTGTIALLTYNKVFIIKNYEGDNFFEGDIVEIKLGFRSQLEGIFFKDSETLYLADESNGIEGGNLYELSLKN